MSREEVQTTLGVPELQLARLGRILQLLSELMPTMARESTGRSMIMVLMTGYTLRSKRILILLFRATQYSEPLQARYVIGILVLWPYLESLEDQAATM